MAQSKQVSAPSSRSILNYQLTCGFFASVLPSDCTEKGQAGGFGGAFADVWVEYNDPGRTFSEVVLPKTCLDLIRRAYPAAESDLTLIVAAGKFMQSLKVIFALVVLAATYTQSATAQTRLGAQSAEGEPHRKQPWLVPSPDPDAAAHAILFRPPGAGPFPLAVIAHASTQNVLRRAQMPQPEYAALSAWLVARGFAVLVPERPGHGATGGKYLEDQGGCDEANYSRAGHATADSIAAALHFLREQPFIRQDGTLVVGHSAGAWGALALAGSNPKGVSGIVAFAPGRGGRANDFPNQVCAPGTLISAATEFGHDARVPVVWLVSANDTYFSPELSRQLADAFRAGGGKVDFRVLAAYGGEGHWLAETDGGIKLAGPELERALKAPSPAVAKKR